MEHDHTVRIQALVSLGQLLGFKVHTSLFNSPIDITAIGGPPTYLTEEVLEVQLERDGKYLTIEDVPEQAFERALKKMANWS